MYVCVRGVCDRDQTRFLARILNNKPVYKFKLMNEVYAAYMIVVYD